MRRRWGSRPEMSLGAIQEWRQRRRAHRAAGGGSFRGGFATAAAILLLFLAACTSPEEGSEAEAGGALLVLAPSSLGAVMPQIISAFEAAHGTPADLVLGATGNLAAQIENGAPADLFFAADEVTVERLVERGRIDPHSVRTYAEGELVIAWRSGATPPTRLEDLADPRYEIIAIANPQIAPYGAAALEALENAGLWDRLATRVVQGESIVQAYQFVRTGNADVGIVARSVVDPSLAATLPVDRALYSPVRHAAGVLVRSRHPAAHPFLDFVLSAEGQKILRRHGFSPGASGRQE